MSAVSHRKDMLSKAEIHSSPLLNKDKLLASIFRISSFLTAPSRVDEILSKILDEVVDTIGFDRGIIRLFDESKQFLHAKVVKNYLPEEIKSAFSVALDIHHHDCLSTKVVKSGQIIAIEDVTTDNRITDTDRLLTKILDRGSIFCAPLKIEEDVIGTLTAWRKEQTKFFPEEINLFLTYANQISIVIQNMRLFETNAEKIRLLILLQEAVSEMNTHYILDRHIQNTLMSTALKIAGADKVLLYVLNIEKDRCLIMDGEKVFIHDRKTCHDKVERGIIHEAIEKNTMLVQQSSPDEFGFEPIFGGYSSQIAIPFYIQKKFKGALYLAKKSGPYSQDQRNSLDILLKNAATTYDNAIMHSLLSLEAKSLKTEVKKLRERQDILLGFHNILGKSQKILDIFKIIDDVARHNTNVLIQGESGTGKELIARAMHRHSGRNTKPFVDVNCAAIPGTLLESELFGYEAGAFTDAKKRKIGLLEHANGGTILLDEVGDMGIPLQAKFLRMLEDGYIRRLGGTENIPIDVRFVFSTNRDLSRMVADGSFREDLYYRISVIPIMIPSLRDRTDDILLLARYFLEEFNRKFGKRVTGFTPEAEETLIRYPWPGNVRELKNIIERVMILQNVGPVITLENLPTEIKIKANPQAFLIPLDNCLSEIVNDNIDYPAITKRIAQDIKGQLLAQALQMSKGNKTKAAKLLGISRYKLIREQRHLNH